MGRTVAAILIVLGLAACEPRGEIVVVPEAARANAVESVYVGTTRAADPQTGDAFSKDRSQVTRYARLDVAIPPDRKPGEIRWTPPRRKPDPRTDFLTTHEELYSDAPTFRADLARALAKERRNTREAVIFVHGFNTTFAEGAYRLAQLGHDLGLHGALVHYSWPSLGHPLGYAYDRDSALFARDGLESLLDEVVAAGAERMVIVAHSMGSALTMETLRQLAISRNAAVQRRIAAVVLISPDIDVDVFRAEAMRIGTLPKPFLIFTSKKDRALALSARLSGQRDRLGNVTDVTEIADLNVTLLDTTAFSTGTGHFNAGNSPALLAILGRIADVDAALAASQVGRPGLLPGAVLTVQSATQIVLSPVAAISGITP
ncbi:alpha/beta hydrolase [Defluviimonas sp. SAOS-178_SWC]|uniref:alpha/beta hydrolase n=1 Tax=Defluviimonas sp. SAOS-178_SWC TaxID=3121287 RepID=UPI00322199AA